MMNSFISLLRGINVGGQKQMRMDDLRILYQGLGFKEVSTYIQSGNILFKSDLEDSAEIGITIHRAIEEKYQFGVDVFIRTAEEMARILQANPFSAEQANPYVVFLDQPAPRDFTSRLEAFRHSSERLFAYDRQIFHLCPIGYGRTKLSVARIEKQLGLRATARNWNTSLKLSELAVS